MIHRETDQMLRLGKEREVGLCYILKQEKIIKKTRDKERLYERKQKERKKRSEKTE